MSGGPGATTAFIILAALAAGFFSYNAQRLIGYLRRPGQTGRASQSQMSEVG